MTERKAGRVWLEWFPGLKIETWGTRCVGVSAKSKRQLQQQIPKGNDRKQGKGNGNYKNKGNGKSKGNSRFPSGMTERKATADAGSSLRSG